MSGQLDAVLFDLDGLLIDSEPVSEQTMILFDLTGAYERHCGLDGAASGEKLCLKDASEWIGGNRNVHLNSQKWHSERSM